MEINFINAVIDENNPQTEVKSLSFNYQPGIPRAFNIHIT